MNFLKNSYHYLLAWCGALIYGQPSKKIFVLGVTGTKGKSTVIELANAILESAGKKTALLSSVRQKIGVDSQPNLTDNTMPGRFFIQKFLRRAVEAGCEYALMEVTSEGVIQSRHRFIDFDAALFLNLHPEHIERHGSFEKYRGAKVKFFADTARKSRKAKKFFFINDHDLASSYFEDAASGSGRVFHFSGKRFLEGFGAKKPANRWLNNDINLENAAAAASFAESQGIGWPVIKSALENFAGVPGRLEIIQDKPFKIVVDYAHTPDSLKKVYQILTSQKSKVNSKKLVCVLGSAGGGRDAWKRAEFGKIVAHHCRAIILTNEDPYDEKPEKILEEIEAGFSQILNPKSEILNLFKIIDRKEAIKKAIDLAKKGDTVIITGKGSEHWMHLAGGQKIAWSDKEAVENVIKELSN